MAASRCPAARTTSPNHSHRKRRSRASRPLRSAYSRSLRRKSRSAPRASALSENNANSESDHETQHQGGEAMRVEDAYDINIYGPGNAKEPWKAFSSETPFLSIHEGDLVDCAGWPGP